MVQRYDDVGYGVFDMGPDQEGAWVKYEDYEKLSNAIDSLLAAVKKGHLTIEHVQGYLEGIQKGFSL